MTKKDNEIIVQKSNILAEARYGWDINEQKIFMIMASDLNEFNGNVWECNVSVLEKLIGTTKLTPTYLKNICEKIISKRVEILDESSNKWKLCNIFQIAEYDKGILKFTITDFAKPHIVDLKEKYTEYKLREIIQFKSQYSIRLYEIIIANYYKTKKLEFRPDEIQKFLGATKKSYDRFSNLDIHVIAPSVVEINKLSNMVLTYTKVMKGRSIDYILFEYKISEKENKNFGTQEDLIYLKKYINDISDKTLKLLLKDYEKDNIILKYYIMTLSSFIGSKSGFLIAALKNDYEIENEIDKELMLTILEYTADKDRANKAKKEQEGS